ncbi:hypothetical protein ACEPAF_10021 [Sanghuangporus sanghuang]|uniref:Uncharacterized protein n=1 Tax=Sanghuangporus baumii TaxID=108892 RepID=A0A9Q5NA72_SANBA|nr:hypothetical protein A7U60_g403 [Sanghuangporus baumii]
MSSTPVPDQEAEREDNFARAIDESLFGCPDETSHVSAFQQPIEPLDNASSSGDDESSRSSISSVRDSLDALRSQARKAMKKSHKAMKKSHKAMKKSAAVLSYQQSTQRKEPDWVRVEKGVEYLHNDDENILRETLEAAQSYTNGELYFRKFHVGIYGEYVNWQVKFEHATRGCQEQARTLKDAARKVKSYLDFSEPSDLDERFKRLFEIIRSDERYEGALILFKEGKGKDYYPWKVRIHHETRGWTKVRNTLSDAIQAMEEHLEYEEATQDARKDPIWERVFVELNNYPKCKVFFKEISEPGPDGELEKVWLLKVDNPIRDVLFETKSRIFEEAAGQVYDFLAGKLEDETKE